MFNIEASYIDMIHGYQLLPLTLDTHDYRKRKINKLKTLPKEEEEE